MFINKFNGLYENKNSAGTAATLKFTHTKNDNVVIIKALKWTSGITTFITIGRFYQPQIKRIESSVGHRINFKK